MKSLCCTYIKTNEFFLSFCQKPEIGGGKGLVLKNGTFSSYKTLSLSVLFRTGVVSKGPRCASDYGGAVVCRGGMKGWRAPLIGWQGSQGGARRRGACCTLPPSRFSLYPAKALCLYQLHKWTSKGVSIIVADSSQGFFYLQFMLFCYFSIQMIRQPNSRVPVTFSFPSNLFIYFLKCALYLCLVF